MTAPPLARPLPNPASYAGYHDNFKYYVGSVATPGSEITLGEVGGYNLSETKWDKIAELQGEKVGLRSRCTETNFIAEGVNLQSNCSSTMNKTCEKYK